MRLVVELKRDANANVVLNQLYKHTPMQTSFAANILALVDGVPRLLSLDRALLVYVNHQIEVVRRRTEFRLRKARDREHIVEGLVKALDMIDAIIALIRGAADVEAARTGLMATPFEFSELQANYILDMQLRRLTQLEGQEAPRRARGAARHHQGAPVHPRLEVEVARSDQDRAHRGPRQVRRRPTDAPRPSTPARSTSST